MPKPNTNRYIVSGEVTTIETVKGDRFVIDTADLSIACKHCWSRHEHGYARAVTRTEEGRMKTVYLHRLLCATSDDRPHVDHANGEQADCRRANLRSCTRHENLRNQKTRSDSRTGIKGVGLHSQSGKYRARVRVDGREQLVMATTIEEAEAAAIAMRSAAHGEFARHA